MLSGSSEAGKLLQNYKKEIEKVTCQYFNFLLSNSANKLIAYNLVIISQQVKQSHLSIIWQQMELHKTTLSLTGKAENQYFYFAKNSL